MVVMLADSDHAIVTGSAITDNAAVIVFGAGKGGGVVTGRTVIRRQQVTAGLDGRDRINAVMAG